MGGACCSRAKREASHGIENRSVCSPACSPEWEFPMYVVAITELLSMDGPPQAHQLLRTQGKVVEWRRGSFCVFLSHQWLSFRHPDPEGKQLRVAREALEKLVSGKLEVRVDPGMEMYLPKKDMPSWDRKVESAALRAGYVWYDFFSIPQMVLGVPDLEEIDSGEAVGIQDHRQIDTNTVAADMRAAVASIPIYVKMCDYFLVVAPPLYHRNTMQLCDYASWSTRGWCRIELWSHILREGRTQPVLLVRSQNWVQFASPWSAVWWRVHEGSFSVESDRSICTELVVSMVNRKIKELEPTKTAAMNQWLAAMWEAVTGQSVEMSEQAFKERFGLQHLGDASNASKTVSLPAITCAALAGQPHLVRRCLDAGCPVDSQLKSSVHGFTHMPKGCTALQAACFNRPMRQLEVIKVLLGARASLEVRGILGMDALAHCTTPGAVDLLVRYGAKIEKPDASGLSPLTALCMFPGNADTVAALIRHNASLSPSPAGLGMTPLYAAAAMNQDAEVVKVLLEQRAHPAATCKPQGMLKFICRALATYHGRRIMDASPLVRFMADCEGSTPLAAAAQNGKAGIMLELLGAGASPDSSNWRGLTARALARREGFPDAFDDVVVVSTSMTLSTSMSLKRKTESHVDVLEQELGEETLSIEIPSAMTKPCWHWRA